MKRNIALITGGLSSEAIVSYQSAENVLNNIDYSKYNIYKIDLNHDGWFYKDTKNKIQLVNLTDFTIIENSEKIKFDGVFICIHGTPGEDGKLQGYFEMLKMPFTGCDSATSTLTFNKKITTALVKTDGIRVARSLKLVKNHQYKIQSILNKLKPPLFIKPNKGGSSIGVSKVNHENELEPAIIKAFKEDNEIIIEQFVVGNEFTVGVYQYKKEIKILPITQIISKNEFFDFAAKYNGESIEITPAEIKKRLRTLINKTAQKIYLLLNCKGVVRIDFIYNEITNNLFMLEVNSVPGQSTASLIPQAVKVTGMKLMDFYSIIIEQMFELES